MSLRFGVVLLALGSVALTGCALETKGSPQVMVPAAQVSLGETKVAPDMALPPVSAPYYVTKQPAKTTTSDVTKPSPDMMMAPAMMMSPKTASPKTPAPKMDTPPPGPSSH